jgi:hypothetical protein
MKIARKTMSKEQFSLLIQSFIGDDKEIDEIFLRSTYGVSLKTMAACWNICRFKEKGTRPEHIFWALHFLKSYDTEVRIAKSYYVTRKTFRKWLWPTVREIARARHTIVSKIMN